VWILAPRKSLSFRRVITVCAILITRYRGIDYMATGKVITVMCAARLPEMLVKRIDTAAASGGVSRAQFIADACRARLDGPTDNASKSVAVPDTRSAKPDMDALRAIAAGKIGKGMVDAESAIDPCALGIQDALSDCPDPCSHIEYCEDDGESYHCSLIAGHKGKCKRGDKG